MMSLRSFSVLMMTGVSLGVGPVWAQGAPLQLRPPAAAVAPRPAQAAAPAGPARIPLPLPRPAEFASAAQPVPVAAPSTASQSPAAAPARVAPASAAPSPAVQPAAVDLSPKTVLERVNVALNAMTTLSADFVQVGGNGRRAEGRLYVQKPGRLRFEYNPPASLEIVADGNSVVIRDGRAGTQDLYGIAQTPLKFLLKEKLDLSRDTRVVDVHPAPDLVSVLLEDRSTFGGTSRIELFFDARTYVLRQWVIVDPQGYQTTVNLRNVDQTHRPDPSLFAIDYTKSMPQQMQSNR